jgi:hypothetical protein
MSSVGNPFLIKEMMKRAHLDDFDMSLTALWTYFNIIFLFTIIIALLKTIDNPLIIYFILITN